MKRRGVLVFLLAAMRAMRGSELRVNSRYVPLEIQIMTDEIKFTGDGRTVTLTAREMMDILEGKDAA